MPVKRPAKRKPGRPRSKSPLVRVSIQLPRELHEALTARADDAGRPLASLIRRILDGSEPVERP